MVYVVNKGLRVVGFTMERYVFTAKEDKRDQITFIFKIR